MWGEAIRQAKRKKCFPNNISLIIDSRPRNWFLSSLLISSSFFLSLWRVLLSIFAIYLIMKLEETRMDLTFNARYGTNIAFIWLSCGCDVALFSVPFGHLPLCGATTGGQMSPRFPKQWKNSASFSISGCCICRSCEKIKAFVPR